MYWETIIKEKMKKLKILILVGMPASGKSTWAREFVSINENWIRITRRNFLSPEYTTNWNDLPMAF
jgi:predicted kinase